MSLSIPPGRNAVAFHAGDTIIATVDEDGAVLIDWDAVIEAAKVATHSASVAVAKMLLAARGG